MTTAPLRNVLGAVRAASRVREPHAGDHGDRRPFITIARQAGAGGTTLAHAVCDQLNVRDHPDPAWQVYDRELVAQLAASEEVSTAMVECFEDASRTWLSDLANGLSFSSPSDERLFRHMATLMHALAERGHVILVGRGGVFVTRALPRGCHVYLVGPLEDRIRNYAVHEDLDDDVAAQRVRDIDDNRRKFHERLSRGEPITPELFDLVLNTSRVNLAKQVDLITLLMGGVRV